MCVGCSTHAFSVGGKKSKIQLMGVAGCVCVGMCVGSVCVRVLKCVVHCVLQCSLQCVWIRSVNSTYKAPLEYNKSRKKVAASLNLCMCVAVCSGERCSVCEYALENQTKKNRLKQKPPSGSLLREHMQICTFNR